jgi:hypothetical protein
LGQSTGGGYERLRSAPCFVTSLGGYLVELRVR